MNISINGVVEFLKTSIPVLKKIGDNLCRLTHFNYLCIVFLEEHKTVWRTEEALCLFVCLRTREAFKIAQRSIG